MRTRAFVGLIALLLVLGGGQSRAANATLTLAAVSPADVAAVDRSVSQMIRGGELRLRNSTVDAMVAGRVHERFDQYYRGVRVFGGDVVRQSTTGGSPLSLFGQMYSDVDVDTTPGITEESAVA